MRLFVAFKSQSNKWLDKGETYVDLILPKNHVVKHINLFAQRVKRHELCTANLKQSFLP